MIKRSLCYVLAGLALFAGGYSFGAYYNAATLTLLDGAVVQNVDMRSVHVHANSGGYVRMTDVHMTLPKLVLPNEPYITLACSTKGELTRVSMVGNWDLYSDAVSWFVGYPSAEPTKVDCP